LRARVLVPAELYPQYHCGERGGVGWEALVVRSTATTAVVHYVSARTTDGRPYADDRLPLSRLRPNKKEFPTTTSSSEVADHREGVFLQD
jgi:hypothetical protein